MKIELISPGTIRGRNNYWAFEEWCKVFGNTMFNLYCLALPTLAALTPPGTEVTITDENLSAVDFNKQVDLVGITCMTFTAKRAYEIADKYRQKGVKVVLGGIHPTMLPEEALEHADSVVIGEAEDVWPQLIEDCKNKKLKKIYSSDNKPDLEKLPLARYDLLDSEKYLSNVVSTTRGCPFNCDFCSVHAFFGKGIRHRAIARVVEEIKQLPRGIRFKNFSLPNLKKPIIFADDNICGNFKYAKDLFRALTPLKIIWWGQASINIVRDQELLKLMSQSGCDWIFVGFESIKSGSLEIMGKRINKIKEYEESIAIIHSHGIYVQGSFILGSDNDDIEDFRELVEFINENDIFVSQITILTPLPGTILYKRLEKEGRLIHKDWDKYDVQTVVFNPKNMTREELQNGFYWVVQQIFDHSALEKRLTALWDTGSFMKLTAKAPFYQRLWFFLYITKYLWTRDLLQVKFILKMMLIAFKKSTDIFIVLWAINFHHFAYSFPRGIDPMVYRENLNDRAKTNRGSGEEAGYFEGIKAMAYKRLAGLKSCFKGVLSKNP